MVIGHGGNMGDHHTIRKKIRKGQERTLVRGKNRMIKELYRTMIQGTKFMEEVEKEIEGEVRKLLAEEERRMHWKDYERHRDQAFQLVQLAEEGGFVKGFQYAVRLMAECFFK